MFQAQQMFFSVYDEQFLKNLLQFVKTVIS
jgi:hypothetical protein